jgi:hypothetical protein
MIAIVGSLDDTRAVPIKPPLRDPVAGKQAAEQLGKALAEKKYRIAVFSARSTYVERDVVRGYVGAGGAGSKSITVIFPQGDTNAADFPERVQHAELFDWSEDRSPNWEMSFYRWLVRVDGVVFLGGGSSTRTAGVLALANRIPMVALAAYGGAAQEVRNAVQPGQDLPSESDFQAMAQPNNFPGWIDSLDAQFALRKKDRWRQARTVSSLIALVLLVVWVLSLPTGYLLLPRHTAAVATESAPPADEPWGRIVFLFLVFVSPMVAGASGATIRNLRAETEPNSLKNTVLGVGAGIMASLLYVLAQLVSNANPYSFVLLMFSVAVGFIAGLTFDAVFAKLETIKVVDSEVLERRG